MSEANYNTLVSWVDSGGTVGTYILKMESTLIRERPPCPD